MVQLKYDNYNKFIVCAYFQTMSQRKRELRIQNRTLSLRFCGYTSQTK